jgi:hypothetical protein
MTAVDYLIHEYFGDQLAPSFKKAYNKAVEMHKQEIIDAYMQGTEIGEMFNNENRAYITDAREYCNQVTKSNQIK